MPAQSSSLAASAAALARWAAFVFPQQWLTRPRGSDSSLPPEVYFAPVSPQSATVPVYCQVEASCVMETAREGALEEHVGCCSAARETEHPRLTDCEAPESCTSEGGALHTAAESFSGPKTCSREQGEAPRGLPPPHYWSRCSLRADGPWVFSRPVEEVA